MEIQSDGGTPWGRCLPGTHLLSCLPLCSRLCTGTGGDEDGYAPVPKDLTEMKTQQCDEALRGHAGSFGTGEDT